MWKWSTVVRVRFRLEENLERRKSYPSAGHEGTRTGLYVFTEFALFLLYIALAHLVNYGGLKRTGVDVPYTRPRERVKPAKPVGGHLAPGKSERIVCAGNAKSELSQRRFSV